MIKFATKTKRKRERKRANRRLLFFVCKDNFLQKRCSHVLYRESKCGKVIFPYNCNLCHSPFHWTYSFENWLFGLMTCLKMSFCCLLCCFCFPLLLLCSNRARVVFAYQHIFIQKTQILSTILPINRVANKKSNESPLLFYRIMQKLFLFSCSR